MEKRPPAHVHNRINTHTNTNEPAEARACERVLGSLKMDVPFVWLCVMALERLLRTKLPVKIATIFHFQTTFERIFMRNANKKLHITTQYSID